MKKNMILFQYYNFRMFVDLFFYCFIIQLDQLDGSFKLSKSYSIIIYINLASRISLFNSLYFKFFINMFPISEFKIRQTHSVDPVNRYPF